MELFVVEYIAFPDWRLMNFQNVTRVWRKKNISQKVVEIQETAGSKPLMYAESYDASVERCRYI